MNRSDEMMSWERSKINHHTFIINRKSFFHQVNYFKFIFHPKEIDVRDQTIWTIQIIRDTLGREGMGQCLQMSHGSWRGFGKGVTEHLLFIGLFKKKKIPSSFQKCHAVWGGGTAQCHINVTLRLEVSLKLSLIFRMASKSISEHYFRKESF